MLVANILLVLPLGAFALPLTEHDEEIPDAAGHKYLLKRAGELNTASFLNPVTDLVKKRADPASDTFTPVAELGKRSHESREILKLRSDDAAESLQLSASVEKRNADTQIDIQKRTETHPDFSQPVPDFWKRAGGLSKLVTGFRKRNNTPSHYEQPNLPEFIDTGACICGLLLDQSTIDNRNGEVIEMWRCTAFVDYDISKGGNGKWYNTTYPSQELSGVNKPRQWAENQPYVGQTYVLTFQNGGASYQLLDAANSGALFGADVNCTGVKDADASTAWYATQ